MIVDGLFERISASVSEQSDRLIAISRDLHAHPELNFAEIHAHDLLSNALESAGFAVERHAGGVQTAFVARAGDGPGPTVAILCEYDALPEIGHACGHNVIAAIGVGAGIAAARVVDECEGRLVVIGTPAEEGGGGKIELIDAHVFDDVDVAMMVHPSDHDLTAMDTIAVAQFRVQYRGVASHAAASPQTGRNALDAAVLGYLNVAALRQHIGATERVHGIFTRAGDAPNIVPAETEAVWFVRSATLATLQALVERVHGCLRAGAEAAGCAISIVEDHPRFAEMVDNPVLVHEYTRIAARFDRLVVEPDDSQRVMGSTDMGNVSQIIPAIHPMIRLAPDGVTIHTEAFAEAAVSSDAERAIVDGASILGILAARCWADPEIVSAARASFDESIRNRASAQP